MIKKIKQALSVIMVVIVILGAAPLSGFVDLDLFDWPNFSLFSTKANAGSNTYYVNSSYSPAYANADKAQLPEGSTRFYFGDTVWLNHSCGENVFIHDAYIYLYRNGSHYQTYHWREQFPVGTYNYFNWWANPVNNIDVGSYSFYYTMTYSTGSYTSTTASFTTDTYYFDVVDRTPSVYASETTVNLNLHGTNSKVVYFDSSCDLSYSYHLAFDDHSTDKFSCSWGGWESAGAALTITGRKVGTNLPLTIHLIRASDNATMASRTIYINITQVEYSIQYNANGGSGAPSTQTKIKDTSISLSTTIPKRTGYTFLGWSTNSSVTLPTYLPGATFTTNSNTTLYAVWKQTTISSGTSVSVPITYGDQMYYYKFTPSTSGKYVIYSTGNNDTKVYLYDSSGNKIDEDDDDGDSTNFRLEYQLSAGTTYYYGVEYYSSSATGTIPVKFGPVYTISYNANGGTGAPSSQSKDYGTDITLSTTKPVLGGYNFLGWSTSSTASTASYSSGAVYSADASVTLYAVWYYVDTVKPTGSITSSNNAAVRQTVTLYFYDDVGIAGYYWGTNSNYSSNKYFTTSSTSAQVTIDSAGTYYLTVKDTSGNLSDRVSVTFYKSILDANGGVVNPEYIISEGGRTITLPKPTKNNYTYSGWNTSKDSTTGSKTITPNSNATYYAIWDYIDTVKPTGSITSSNNVAASQTVELKLSDNVGVAGYYWGSSSNYSSNLYYTSNGGIAKADVSSPGTYYLVVKDTSGNLSDRESVTFYKTTLNANGGSVTPATVLTKSGNSFTLPVPIKSNYEYMGWSTVSTDTSGIKSLTPTSNKTYYALWRYIDTVKPTGSITSSNNVAASQTVELKLSDNVGVAGYYWGSSSNYSSNLYYTSNGGIAKVDVSSPGTYYLVVKDTSGNLSDRESVTFYKTTLNANGGTVNPSEIITESGKSFVFPTPLKNNNIYSGWDKSSSAKSGITTLKVTGSATYFAVWSYNDTVKPTGSINSTNNLANSQKVTLTLSDNVGVAGYYWGTNSNYRSNKYVETSNSSVQETVTSPGKYYLTVADTNGNISLNYDVTFYMTTLNANGGTVSPAAVLTEKGKSFTFPIPLRERHTYLGWSSSVSDSNGVSTLSPSENKTYYAMWSKPIVLEDLTYSFENNRIGFQYDDAYLKNEWLKSCRLIFNDTTMAGTIKDIVRNWGGNCFGMSTTSGLFNATSTELSVTDFNINANYVSDLVINDMHPTLRLSDKFKDQRIDLRRFIEAMQCSQFYAHIQSAYRDNTGKITELCELIKRASTTGEFPVIALFGPEGGHAVVGYSVEKISDTESRINLYDCNYPNKKRYITLTTDSQGVYTGGWSYQISENYSTWNEKVDGCRISYVPYGHYKVIWDYQGRPYEMFDYLKLKNGFDKNGEYLTLNSENFEILDMDGDIVCKAENGELTTYNDNIFEVLLTDMEINAGYALDIPRNYYIIKNKDESIDSFNVDIVDFDLGASVSTQADTITVAVDDAFDINLVNIEAKNGESFEVSLYSSLGNGYETIDFSGVGGGSTVELSCVQGKLDFAGHNLTGATLIVDGVDKNIGGGNQGDEKSDVCDYCGKAHTGLFGKIIAFFHRVFYKITHLFK